MVNVAIAGGTSPTLGRLITDAILATKKHQVIILSRAKTQSEQDTTSNLQQADNDTKHGAPIKHVDYTSIPSLINAFTTHNINILISVLKPLDPNETITYHSNLLSACQSAQVQRFIMSDWSLAPASHTHVSMLGHKAQLHELSQEHMLAAQQNDEFVVECCTIQNGGFLEYFVQRCGDLELQAGLEDDLMLEYIDIGNRKLVIPCVETGEPARVTMTSLRDIANFVAASLYLPRGVMTGQIGITGWTGTFENVADVLKRLEPAVDVEKVCVTAEQCLKKAEQHGQTFRAKMGKGEFDLVAFKGEMVAQMYAVLCGEEDSGGVVCGKTLNELCPDVKTANLKELLHKAWQRRSDASC